MVGGLTATVLSGVASITLLVEFLYNYRQAFSPYVYLTSTWCIYVVVLIRPLLGKLRFFLSDRFGFHRTNNQSMAAHAFANAVWMSFSVHDFSFCFRGRWEPSSSMKMWPLLLNHVYSAFKWRPTLSAVCFRLCSRNSAWVGILARSSSRRT